MPTVTLKLPARYATVRPASLLTCGVEVIIDHLTLSSLADAINAMEHNDTDPGERRMNADQCRDALLREVLHSWTPSELVKARIPAVLELAEQVARVATLTRERDEARAEIDAMRKSEQGEAPDGYRMLPLGSLIKDGDLVRLALDPNDKWDPTDCDGSEHNDNSLIYCRKIDTPTPGAQA